MDECVREANQITYRDAFLKIIVLLVVLLPIVLTWYLDQKAKLDWQKHIQKEERYVLLLESVSGFYVSSLDEQKREEFARQMRVAFLYCPDDVITAGNIFLESVSVGASFSDEEKEDRLAKFVLALRRDLYGETKLTVKDWRTWGVPDKPF